MQVFVVGVSDQDRYCGCIAAFLSRDKAQSFVQERNNDERNRERDDYYHLEELTLDEDD